MSRFIIVRDEYYYWNANHGWLTRRDEATVLTFEKAAMALSIIDSTQANLEAYV